VSARLAAQWRERGATLTTARDTPPKAAHGRVERRELWALADPAWNAAVGTTGSVGKPWPHVRQLWRMERQRIIRRTGEVSHEVTFGITSLPPEHADATHMLSIIRDYWAIENRSHYVRDVTLGEDHAQIRSGAAPQAVAICRNLVLALIRRAGATNVAESLRTFAARPHAAVTLVLGHSLT